MAAISLCKIDGCGKPSRTRGWCNKHWLRWYRHGDPLAGGRFKADSGEPMKWLSHHTSFSRGACLIWPFARIPNGYGTLGGKGNTVGAHVVMCESAHGPAPSALHEVAHSCGNGHLGCVNPNHLRWATKKENGQDKVAHGRSPRGEKNPASKIDRNTAMEIFRRKKFGGQRTVAAEFNVSRDIVRRIWLGSTWSWMTGM